GRKGERIARFLGVDGPRWMIRAMIMGKAALNQDQAALLYDILKNTVIDRGEQPLPARQMLELTPPENVQVAMREAAARRRQEAKSYQPAKQNLALVRNCFILTSRKRAPY